MIPPNLSQSSLPLKKRKQDQSHLPTSTQATNNLYPCPIFFECTIEDQGADGGKHHGHQGHQRQLQEKSDEFLLINGSNDFLRSFSANSNDHNDKMDQYFCDGDHNEDGHGSVEWMSSKTQWVRRRMMGSQQTVTSKPRRRMEDLQGDRQQNQDSSSNFQSGIIRTCSDCSTTRTPLWRSGPQGPKSLCNACGIRQRRARRAMAAAAAAAGTGLISTNTLGEVQKGKRTGGDHAIPNKKRCSKITNTGTAQKELQTDDLIITSGDNSAFHRVFPQDEKDAAILLMALSCGLIHG